MKKWIYLPQELQCDEVFPYYSILRKKQISLIFKRIFDIAASSIMLVVLSPVFIILAIVIKLDSPGPVFFRQVRVTQYGKLFRIYKFRTMICDAELVGNQITSHEDRRITRVGRIIRRCHLDEIAQLIDVLRGEMTFVGVRPEVEKYVKWYTPEMRATLLMPAGVTNLTSIYFNDEAKMMQNSSNIDEMYITQVLPSKMKWNLKGLVEFSFWNDIKLMVMTFFVALGKKYTT